MVQVLGLVFRVGLLNLEMWIVLHLNVIRHLSINFFNYPLIIRLGCWGNLGGFSYHCGLRFYGRGSSHQQRVWCWTGHTKGSKLVMKMKNRIGPNIAYLVEHQKGLCLVLRPHHQWLLFWSDHVGSFYPQIPVSSVVLRFKALGITHCIIGLPQIFCKWALGRIWGLVKHKTSCLWSHASSMLGRYGWTLGDSLSV